MTQNGFVSLIFLFDSTAFDKGSDFQEATITFLCKAFCFEEYEQTCLELL